MTLSFRYKTVKRPDGTEVKTPSIPLVLLGKEKFETLALIDSGADVSVIPKAIAELLGIDLSGKRSPAFGIGGKVDSIDAKLNIVIEKGHERYPLTIPVKVMLDTYEFPMLLGRAGFFEEFVVVFDQTHEKVLLKRAGKR